MLQIEEWFRRPQKKTERKAPAAGKSAASVTHRAEEKQQKVSAQPIVSEAMDIFEPEDGIVVVKAETGVLPNTPEKAMHTVEHHVPVEEEIQTEEPAAVQTAETQSIEPAAEPVVNLQDTVAESEKMEQITEKIGLDVTEMIDLDKEDYLLKQIDEFREKAKQLQQLMSTRETKAKQLQSEVAQKEAKASELDDLITVRQGEADKIMGNVSDKIDAMSASVRREMSGLSDTVSKEVSGLSQEISESAETTRQVVEAATRDMIDQNTRSLEGLKEQLDQLGQLEQINELSTEMNSQITTLKTDIADRIHSEDVKCYRNIQASMDEQSKMLSEGDEKTRQHIEEQVTGLETKMKQQALFLKVMLGVTIANFVGIVGILLIEAGLF